MSSLKITGFRDHPEQTASGADYPGKLCCDDVQITGEGIDAIATFTVTVRQLLDASTAGMLWTDQDVQRGIRPEVVTKVSKELSLGNGYPNKDVYIFNSESADDMTEKLLNGRRLFINPLVWNLRPGTFDAYYHRDARRIYIYEGKIYLPDSHHRHQAILKAAQIYKTAPNEYPHFDLNKQFKIELYFLKRIDEGNYFFDKNQRPTPTAKSKAFDLTSLDDLSVLAKRVIELTPTLQNNVNRVTDRLTAKNPNVVTLSTLREMLKIAVGVNELDETEIDGFAQVASKLIQLLTESRPELGKLDIGARKIIRSNSLVDSPIMFLGYSALIADFNSDVAKQGMSSAVEQWTRRLGKINKSVIYSESSWSGDLFEKINPLWTRIGVVKPGVKGNPTLSNTHAVRSQAMKALRAILLNEKQTHKLEEIVL